MQLWKQPLSGLALLILLTVPLFSWELIQNGNIGIDIVLFTLSGLFLGYALTRSSTGLSGPVKKIVQNGDARQAQVIIIFFMICSIFAGIAIIAFGESTFAKPLQTPLGVGTILGSLLFGSGMIFATGGVSGTFTALGRGVVPSIAVFFTFILGSAVGVSFYDSKIDINFLDTNKSGSIAVAINSVVGSIFINILLLFIVLLIATFIHKWRAYRKTQVLVTFEKEVLEVMRLKQEEGLDNFSFFSYFTWERIFRKRWSWIVGACALIIWFGFNVFVLKNAPGISTACAHWGVAMFGGFGSESISSFNQDWQMMNDTQSWQNIGIIVGSSLALLFANKFKFSGYQNQKPYNWVLFLLGGFMIGIACRLNRGGTTTAMISGLTFQTGFGWVSTICVTLSGASTAWFIKKIRHNTPFNVYYRHKK